jgi:hypothetical protein
MRDWVAEWVQEGTIYVWRYQRPRQSQRGWHFTGDPAGCRSVRNLIDRMCSGEACHRTLRLGKVTEDIWRVPNFGPPKHEHFARLRLEFVPDADDLSLEVDGDRLILTAGNKRIRKLGSAFADVEIGDGDFGLATSASRKAEHWMFWWMPREQVRVEQ